MLLRQYFMQLKVLDRWAHFGPHISQHWGRVVSNVTKSHPVLPPTTPTTTTAKQQSAAASGWDRFSPARMRARRASVGPLVESETEVDRDAAAAAARSLPGVAEEGEDSGEEKELRIMRKVFRRWCKRAGVHALADEELGEDGVGCDWTQPIAPKVEGRIVMVGSG